MDFSSIKFDLTTFEDSEENFPQVKSLVLSNLNITRQELRVIAKTFPGITNLVLSDTTEDMTDIFQSNFQNVKFLCLNFSLIDNFEQVLNLQGLRNLIELKLCQNNLQKIPQFTTVGFENLTMINLEETSIHDLESVYNLNNFPALKEIRIGETPLCFRFKNHFRNLLIAYLPNADHINGGAVDSSERITAERNFIREFSDPDLHEKHIDFEVHDNLASKLLPIEYEYNIKVFDRLFTDHGIVYKFAEVDLSAPNEVMLRFETTDGRSENYIVPLH